MDPLRGRTTSRRRGRRLPAYRVSRPELEANGVIYKREAVQSAITDAAYSKRVDMLRGSFRLGEIKDTPAALAHKFLLAPGALDVQKLQKDVPDIPFEHIVTPSSHVLC